MRAVAGRRACGGLAAVLLLASCLAPREDRSRYFMLEPTPLRAGNAGPGGPALGLGPIQMPGYLKGPEMLMRTGPNELRPSLTDRWAEPLELALPRVLAQNVVGALGSGRVVPFPWYESEKPDFQIQIDIDRFEPRSDRLAVLDARWSVVDLADRSLRIDGTTNARRAASGSTADAIAAALSTCIADLGSDIAAAVTALEEEAP